MNKGLEVIEAHHLFGVSYDDITVVVHPQSCVHSMVEFADGSVKAHLGATDMRVPIQYAFSYPDRWDAPVPPVDFRSFGALDFEAADTDTFRCLALALQRRPRGRHDACGAQRGERGGRRGVPRSAGPPSTTSRASSSASWRRT